MTEYSIKDYGIFGDAITTTQNASTAVDTAKTSVAEANTKLSDQSIFMGPIQEECVNALKKADTKMSTMIDSLTTISQYLEETGLGYQAGDNKAKKIALGKKNINTNGMISGSNVANATEKYKSEIENADYATVDKDFFSTTTTDYINGQEVKVTHVVINSGDQINGAPANGSYGNGVETSSDAAKRLNTPLLVNGSFFHTNGTEDLSGNNHVVIVNGEIKHDGVSGGQEIFLDNNGNIYNASGKTAQQLVDDGVKYTFSSHSTQVIENGDTSPSYREQRHYRRTVIGQAAPGEYYIVTDTTDNNVLSDTAEYLKAKGCNNAYSMDQGGSVTLVRDQEVINNPRDGGERPVADFLYFTA